MPWTREKYGLTRGRTRDLGSLTKFSSQSKFGISQGEIFVTLYFDVCTWRGALLHVNLSRLNNEVGSCCLVLDVRQTATTTKLNLHPLCRRRRGWWVGKSTKRWAKSQNKSIYVYESTRAKSKTAPQLHDVQPKRVWMNVVLTEDKFVPANFFYVLHSLLSQQRFNKTR